MRVVQYSCPKANKVEYGDIEMLEQLTVAKKQIFLVVQNFSKAFNKGDNISLF